MKTDLETQLREFASRLEGSLAEIDVSEIQRLVDDAESARLVADEPPAATSESRRRLSRLMGFGLRGPLVAAGTAILVLLLAVVPLVLTSNGDTDPGPPAGEQGPLTSSETEPSELSGVESDQPIQPFAGLPILEVEAIRATWGQLSAACMVEAGYSEFADISLGAAAASSTLAVAPLLPAEFGPTTLAEARQSGYDPTVLFPDPGFPKVVGAEAEQMFSTCRSLSWSRIGPAALEVVSQIESLANQLHNSLRGQLIASPASREVFIERTECLAGEGYPVDPDDPILFRPEPEKVGITFGNMIPSGSAGSSPDSVLRQPPAEKYQPTNEEVDLAVSDFHCRQQIEHFDRTVAAAAPIQRELMAAHATELQQLQDRLTGLAEVAAATQAESDPGSDIAINIIERDGLALSVTRSADTLCFDVAGAQGRAGRCGTDLSDPLVIGAGSLGGRGFLYGWAPLEAEQIVITLADGDKIESADLVSVEGFDVQFFLEPVPLDERNETDLPIEAAAFDADSQQIARFVLGNTNDTP